MNKLIWLGCLSYLVIGMAHVVAGSVLEPVVRWYGLDYREGAQWIMNQFLGFLIGVLGAPLLTRFLGRRNTILLSFGCLTAAEIVYGLLPAWGWMLAAGPLAGFGFGLIEAVIGATVIEFVEEREAIAMTKLETFFGLGALAMPAIAALLISHNDWRLSFPLLAVISAVTGILWQRLSFGKADRFIARNGPRTAKHAHAAGYSRGGLPVLAVGILFFTFYVGMEMSFSNYLPSLMTARTGIGEAAAASSMSLFWTTMVVGRSVAGRVAERWGYGRFLFVSTGAGLLSFLAITLTANAVWNMLFTALGGLFWSGVFSIMLLYVNRLLPGQTERTTSILVACGGLGGAVFPKWSGWIMDRYEADAVVWLLAGMSAFMLLLLGIVYFARLGGNPAADHPRPEAGVTDML